MIVTFAEDHICFRQYPFAGASVHPTGVVTPDRIRDAEPGATPPEIRTTRGETLFVPHDRRAELEEFGHRHGIAVVRRRDVWADLLEPFLDTEIGAEAERATDERLHRAGIPRPEVRRIRDRLTPLMTAYNFDSMLWEWAYLGLFHLLSAVNGPLVPPGIRAGVGDPAKVHAWAMDIAERGQRG
ncbi:hypothetical protein AB0J40_19105 [Amycolatopsis sp. NPDC049691]|uniref:hypothetical protein n=1 Tax=Amycolatopsis sp. NPDC049691 TaxID=3155155 RepID=UPI0034397732